MPAPMEPEQAVLPRVQVLSQVQDLGLLGRRPLVVLVVLLRVQACCQALVMEHPV